MQIERGELTPGDSLPTLAEMAERWTCSIGSARAAVALLKAQGLISSGRGKAPGRPSPAEEGHPLIGAPPGREGPCRPTAHAEVMALRHAGAKLGRHLFEDGVMYASSEPCPMCLIACYWARIPRLIFGASSHDVATYGFEDLQFYREVAQPIERRSLREDLAEGTLRTQAVEVLRAWADKLPVPVEPKF